MSVELENINGQAGGSGGGGSSSKGTLFDIKTMAQAIADKGWAFTCKSTRQDLAKTDVPTLYPEIKDKYDNADVSSEGELSAKISDVDASSNVVYCNGNYYVVVKINGQDGGKLYKSTDGDNWNLIDTISIGQSSFASETTVNKLVVCGNKVVGAIAEGFLFIYDTSTETLTSTQYWTGRGFNASLVAWEGYLYFFDGNKAYKIAFDDISITMDNKIEIGTKEFLGFDGTYYYGTDTYEGSFRALYKGTSIDSMDTEVAGGYADPYMQTTFNGNINDFKICVAKSIVSIQNGVVSNYDISSSFTNGLTNLQQIGNTLFANHYFTGGSYKSIDNGENWLQVYSTEETLKIISGANGKEFAGGGTNKKFYAITYPKQVSTDTYVINGSEVEIDYYTKDGFKICLADGTNDTNLASVYSYMGYYNYYRLDTANETISLPRNSNLYSMMYVGDNYQDTLDGISGNATRLLPQAENINVTGATPEISVSANKTYSFDTAITSLTISDVEVSALESVLYFTTGAGTISLSAPNTLRWGGGNEQPTLEPNTVYCIAIRNGLAEIDNFGSAS